MTTEKEYRIVFLGAKLSLGPLGVIFFSQKCLNFLCVLEYNKQTEMIHSMFFAGLHCVFRINKDKTATVNISTSIYKDIHHAVTKYLHGSSKCNILMPEQGDNISDVFCCCILVFNTLI